MSIASLLQQQLTYKKRFYIGELNPWRDIVFFYINDVTSIKNITIEFTPLYVYLKNIRSRTGLVLVAQIQVWVVRVLPAPDGFLALYVEGALFAGFCGRDEEVAIVLYYLRPVEHTISFNKSNMTLYINAFVCWTLEQMVSAKLNQPCGERTR